MERHLQLKIQGPSNNAAQQQQQNVDERLVERGGGGALGYGYGDFLLNTQQEQFLKEKQQTSPAMFALPSLLGKMSFLEMLQSMESPPFSPPRPFTQSTSWLHQQQQQKKSCTIKMEMLESCISHEICEEEEARSRVKCHSHPAVVSKCCYVGASISGSGSAAEGQLSPQMRNNTIWPPKEDKIRKKRERTTTETTTARASKKNKGQVESQRMTHITVERNRRKQMNDHLNALRSLMPTAFVQKGDQASIIGGAIDFVKELEQLLQSLEVEKRMRMHASSFSFSGDTASSSSCNNSNNNNTNMMTSESLQELEEEEEEEEKNDENEIGRRRLVSPHDQHNIMMNDIIVNKNESKSSSGNGNKRKDMEIQVMVIELHVNLKIVCPRRQGQLLRVIAAFEGIGLTVLHVNVNSFDINSLLYSFNLKIEDGCQFGSADKIAAVVNQIFSYIDQQQQ